MIIVLIKTVDEGGLQVGLKQEVVGECANDLGMVWCRALVSHV